VAVTSFIPSSVTQINFLVGYLRQRCTKDLLEVVRSVLSLRKMRFIRCVNRGFPRQIRSQGKKLLHLNIRGLVNNEKVYKYISICIK
jgi:hypothetical protein